MVTTLGENSQGSPRIAIIFCDGHFSVVSTEQSQVLGSVQISPNLGVSAILEIMIDCIFALKKSFSDGFKTSLINQDLKFLDSEKPDPLGNSRSIRVGPRGGDVITSPPWESFFEDILVEILDLQQELMTGKQIHLPPNIYEEDAKQALKAIIAEINEVRKINVNVSSIANLNQKIQILKKELSNKDKKIISLKAEVQKRSHPGRNQKQIKIGFHDRSKVQHSDQHEIDPDAAILLINLLGKCLKR